MVGFLLSYKKIEMEFAMEVVWITLGILVIGMLIYGALLNSFPKTEYYEIFTDKINADVKLVFLTDLHGCVHGKENETLIHMIEKEEPDFICIAGDMTVKNGKGIKEAVSLLKTLREKYPIFYAPGNHEIRMEEYDSYKKMLQEIQVSYLENAGKTEKGIRIIGLDLDEYWYHKCWQKRDFTEEHLTELLGKNESEQYSILIAHNPEYFPQYAKWGADVTLSGHVHGGIARLPILGGVIAPSLRLFPKYDAGKFEKNGKYMILSRGLGLHHIKLRFFNRPEVSVINLTCQFDKK